MPQVSISDVIMNPSMIERVFSGGIQLRGDNYLSREDNGDLYRQIVDVVQKLGVEIPNIWNYDVGNYITIGVENPHGIRDSGCECTTKGIDHTWHKKLYSAIMQAIEYVCDIEGPLWDNNPDKKNKFREDNINSYDSNHWTRNFPGMMPAAPRREEMEKNRNENSGE